MASKKGIAVTIIILVGVIIASFSVYLIPEDTEMKITVSDFEKHLDDVDQRTSMLSMGVEESFDDLLNHNLTSEEYFVVAGVTQSQVNSLIIELTLSGAPQEWTESYKTYIFALKKLNEQITQTMIIANLMKDDGNSDSVNEMISNLYELRAELRDLISESNNLRP